MKSGKKRKTKGKERIICRAERWIFLGYSRETILMVQQKFTGELIQRSQRLIPDSVSTSPKIEEKDGELMKKETRINH